MKKHTNNVLKKGLAILLMAVVLVGNVPVQNIYGTVNGATTPGTSDPVEVRTISGQVFLKKDNKKLPLKQENIIFTESNVTEDGKNITTSACTNEKGEYEVELKKNTEYTAFIQHGDYFAQKNIAKGDSNDNVDFELKRKPDNEQFAFPSYQTTYGLGGSKTISFAAIGAESGAEVTYSIKYGHNTSHEVARIDKKTGLVTLNSEGKTGIIFVHADKTSTDNYCSKSIKTSAIQIDKSTPEKFTFAKSTDTIQYDSKNLTYKNNPLTVQGGGTGKVTYKIVEEKTLEGKTAGKGKVATVNSENGNVTVAGVGSVIVRATKEATNDYKGASAEYTLTILKTSKKKISFTEDTLKNFKVNPESTGYSVVYSTKSFPLAVWDGEKNILENVTYTVLNTDLAYIEHGNQLKLKSADGLVEVHATWDDHGRSAECETVLKFYVNRADGEVYRFADDIYKHLGVYDQTSNTCSASYSGGDKTLELSLDKKLIEGLSVQYSVEAADGTDKVTNAKITNKNGKSYLTITGAGKAFILKALVTDEKNRYKNSEVQLRVLVEKSEQSEFANASDVTLTYKEGGIYHTFCVSNNTNTGHDITYQIIKQTDVDGKTVDYEIAAFSDTDKKTLVMKNAGIVTIRVSKQGNDNYRDKSKEIVVKINKANQREFYFYNGQNPYITYGEGSGTAGDCYAYPIDNKHADGAVQVNTPVKYSIVEQKTLDGRELPSGEAVVKWANAGNGTLKLIRSGKVRVRVYKSGNRNYNPIEGFYELTIGKAGQPSLVFVGKENSYAVKPTSNANAYETDVVFHKNKCYELETTGGVDGIPVSYSLQEGQEHCAEIKTVDGKTYVRPLKAVDFTVIATKAENDCYNGTSATLTFKVAKAPQTPFDFYKGTEVSIEYDDNLTYQYEITNLDADGENEVPSQYVQYQIMKQTDLNNVELSANEKVADFTGNKPGELAIYRAGIIIVRVYKAGDNNYHSVEGTYTLRIEQGKQRELGFNSDELSITEVSRTEEKISFGCKVILGCIYHLDITGGSGKGNISSTIANESAIKCEIKNEKQLTMQVLQLQDNKITAQQQADNGYLSSNIAELNINAVYETTPDTPYTISGTISETGWYREGEVAIVPKAGYWISDTCSVDANWADSYPLPDANTEARTVYLRNKATGGITDAIIVPAKEILIDKAAPEALKITYDRSPVAELLENITFGYYNAPVYATLTATDATAGLQSFTYSYMVEDGVSSINKGKENVKIELNGENSYTFEIPAQFKGRVMFEAVDNAGNRSSYTDNEKGIVVDTIAPSATIRYTGNRTDTVNGDRASVTSIDDSARFVYNSDITAEILIEEANFNEDNIIIAVAKDSNQIFDYTQSAWEHVNGDTYRKTITFTEDGNYQIAVAVKDNVGQEMQWSSSEYDGKTGTYQYNSNVMTIDKTAPVVVVTYDANVPVRDNMYNMARTATIRVADNNFRPEDVELTIFQAVDGTGKQISSFNRDAIKENLKTWNAWKKISAENESVEIWEAKIAYNVDAHYQFAMECFDIADNKAADQWPADFYVDTNAPDASSLKVTYTTSLLDKVLGFITFGYYQSDVTVTLQADDLVTGVESFTWNYQKEADASNANVLTDGSTIPVTAVSGLTSAATFTLTAEEAKQYRGNISFVATDKIGNVSGLLSDTATTLVVDNIAPECKVTYNQPAQTITSEDAQTWYYSENVTATIAITEANFYEEDIVVKVNNEEVTLDKDWKQSNDVWTNSLSLTSSGNYKINISYKDRSNNQMKEYTSDKIVIDKEEPVLKVAYSNQNPVQVIEGRSYYDADQKAVLTITEHNFRASDVEAVVTAKDVAGNDIEVTDYNSYLKKAENWKKNGDVYTAEIHFKKDANYTFTISYADLAMQKTSSYKKDVFTVDKQTPENLSISYSVDVFEQVLERITFGYYNAKATVTITAEDMTSPINTFSYSYLKANGVSSINKELVEAEIKANEITYSEANGEATAEFQVLKTALDAQNQFNGTVSFTAKDSAGNEASLDGDRRLVVDTIAPTAEVTYNTPVSSDNGVAYYADAVDAQIVVEEANFDNKDVLVAVTKDGKEYAAAPSWTDNSADTHIGAISLTEDGDYVIKVNYEDKSTNAMPEYVSEQLTVDTTMEAPKITINGQDGNGMAYQGEAVLGIQFLDVNFADYEIVLTRTNLSGSSQDVTEQFITGLTVNDQGGYGTFDTFEETEENDGVYHLTVKMRDKAGNEAVSETAFTLNRFGSVYVYDDYLLSTLNQYTQGVTSDLVITEYNPNQLLEGSIQINITCDGKPVEVPAVAIKEQENSLAEEGKGWYQYEYRIASSNFKTDGVYKIVVSSKDAAGNKPENASRENQEIQFCVDTHAPEITSIVGLEEAVINAQSVQVTYDVFDAIGLKRIRVLVDDEVVDNITDFSNDYNAYNGAFAVGESNSARKVRLIAEDLAGNITDTSGKSFSSAYTFNSDITVSTNAFIRWYANKPLVAVTIGGGAGGIAVAALGIQFYKKRRLPKKAKK